MYTSALLHLRMGNRTAVDERYRLLEGRAADLGHESLAYHLIRRLEGLRNFELGEYDQAIEALTQGLDYRIERGFLRMSLSMDATARSTRAEALAALGRYEEAIATYRSLTDGFLFVDASWLGPSFLRSAQWYEELGDTDSAIDFYGRFVELWENADPHLQFQVEDARARLNELTLRNAAEPRQ